MQDFAKIRKGNAILLGEVDEGLSNIADYIGGGNRLQALFNFPLNRYIFLGLAQESADPINFGLNQLPTIPGEGQWVNFLRHHDELNLSRMTNEQRQQVFTAFGPEPEMQIFDRGLRRRLAPMLGGDQARIRMAYSLLFSLPGAPMVFYGEEIGMGEQMELEGRMSVRAPMQWTPGESGGFSSAPAEDLVRPLLTDGDYGLEKVNVAGQRADKESLRNWMATLIRVRKECGEIGTGTWQLMETGNDSILALRYDVDDSAVVVLNNLSNTRHTISLDLTDVEMETATDLWTGKAYEPIDHKKRSIRLDGYGFRWMRLGGVY
jgi:maltose alpha-D-glucosyltransferase/alpha-amylase